MKAQITIDRARIWMAIAAVGVVALGSFWLYDTVRRQGADDYNRASARLEPDYYVENFNFIKLSNNGKANYHVTGKNLIHLPRTDQYDIKEPRISSFDAQRTPITINAGRAVVEQKSEVLTPKRAEDVVHLYDQVTVERPQGLNSSFMRVETEYLQLLPDADIVKTDQRIKLITDNGETLATGMMANNTNQELRLLSKVHARLSKHK